VSDRNIFTQKDSLGLLQKFLLYTTENIIPIDYTFRCPFYRGRGSRKLIKTPIYKYNQVDSVFYSPLDGISDYKLSGDDDDK